MNKVRLIYTIGYLFFLLVLILLAKVQWTVPQAYASSVILSIIIELLFLLYLLCWALLVPLGLLLLLPSFTLKTTLHRIIWYTAVVIPQILLLVFAHFVIYDQALIGADISFIIGTPLMILCARCILPLAKRFILAANAAPRKTQSDFPAG